MRRKNLCLALVIVSVAFSVLPRSSSAYRSDEPRSAVNAAEVTAGMVLFLQHCASCHGAAGRGNGPDADLFPTPPRDLHEGFVSLYDDESLIERIRNGRTLGLAVDIEALRRHSARVDQLALYIRRLPGIDWDVVEPGWANYVDRCEFCHGPTGEGPTSSGISRTPKNLIPLEHTGEALLEAIGHERTGQPRLDPPIGRAEARRIAAFVGLFSEGFSVYSRICANCHSDDGRGMATLGTVAGEMFPLPDIIFDDEFFARRTPEDLREGIWHMLTLNKPAMPHFRRTLTATEAKSIVAYLRSTEPTPRSPQESSRK